MTLVDQCAARGSMSSPCLLKKADPEKSDYVILFIMFIDPVSMGKYGYERLS